MIELFKFILVAIGAVGLFYGLLRWLAARTENADTYMFSQLAEQLNGEYIQMIDTIFSPNKDMLDFGMSTLPIEKMVCGKLLGINIYLFEQSDEAIDTGYTNRMVPVWSVCLLEMQENLLGFEGLICFHKKDSYGWLEKYKPSSPEWEEFQYGKGKLKNHQVLIEGMKDTKDMRHQKSWTCSENIGLCMRGGLFRVRSPCRLKETMLLFILRYGLFQSLNSI